MEPPEGVQPFCTTVAFAAIAAGPPTGKVTTLEQLAESVMVQVYIPGLRLLIVAEVAPLLHRNVYGGKPLGVTVIDPSLLFEQVAFVMETEGMIRVQT
jgi:hypothetical protein